MPRSSIIISDEPLSRETNYRTEFVAVLSNQPQGGFKTRKPTPSIVNVPVASNSNPWGGTGGFFGFGYFDQPAPRQKPGKYAPPKYQKYNTNKKQVQKPLWW